MKKSIVLSFILVLSPLVACGDDDGGTNNNNHQVQYDAATQNDAAAQQDAAVQHDAAAQHDAAVQHDAAPQPDGSTPGNGVVGDPCADVGQCGGIVGGLPTECLTSLMSFITFPGGYCTAACTAGDPDPCADSGGVCLNVTIASYCVKPCTDVSECRGGEGYTCTANPMGGGTETYCLPPMGVGP